MRYLPLSDHERQEMLDAIGVKSIDDLYRDVPGKAYRPSQFDLPTRGSELEVSNYFKQLSARNKPVCDRPSFLGAGAYYHHVPASVDALIQRGEFLTAYTPYQPEISQGTLQAIYEFQTQVAMITGMDVANASMYDGATSCAEAVLMAHRLHPRQKVIMSGGVHPHYVEVTRSHVDHLPIEYITLPPSLDDLDEIIKKLSNHVSCVVVQYPNLWGGVSDLTQLAKACHEHNITLIVVVTEIVALGLLPSPGSMGADIVVGEGQSLGNSLNFGGPTVGLFACRDQFVRQMPGRLAGETTDAEGKRGWVLTLSTREQHIRREKATSNICTNAGLCALAFSIHLALLGDHGYRELAQLNHQRAIALYEALQGHKAWEVLNTSFFNEMTVKFPDHKAEAIVQACLAKDILIGVPASRLYPGVSEVENLLLMTATEMTSEDDINKAVKILKEVCHAA